MKDWPTVISYEEWFDREYQALIESEIEAECPKCYGCGEQMCDHCDNYSECERCDGQGKVIAADLERDELRESTLSRKAYKSDIKESAEKLAAWMDINKYLSLAHYGFHVYTDADTRKERVSG